MNWLLLSFFLSLGAVNYHVDFVNPEKLPLSYTTEWPMFQSTVGVEALIADHVFAGGAVQTWETPGSIASFSPVESLYTFSAGVRFDGFEIGWKHECDHVTLGGLVIPGQGFSAVRNDVYLSYRASVKVF